MHHLRSDIIFKQQIYTGFHRYPVTFFLLVQLPFHIPALGNVAHKTAAVTVHRLIAVDREIFFEILVIILDILVQPFQRCFSIDVQPFGAVIAPNIAERHSQKIIFAVDTQKGSTGAVGINKDKILRQTACIGLCPQHIYRQRQLVKLHHHAPLHRGKIFVELF